MAEESAIPNGKKLELDPQIRAAILKNRGGWEKASDEEIHRIWHSLHKETQAQYLASLQEKEEEADDRTQP